MRKSILYIFIFFIATILGVSVAHAQDSTLIEATPENPTPFENVSLDIGSTYRNAFITWTVNDQIIQQGEGLTSVEIQMGDLGSRSLVVVTAELSGGQRINDSILLIPADVDLVVESENFVPPFYRGRSLVPAEGRARVVAIPHIADQNGVRYNEDELIYTWRYNRGVISERSGIGRDVFTFTLPPRNTTVEVEVSSPDGRVKASGRAIISPADSLVRVYRDHPLQGVILSRSLIGSFVIPSAEETFVAFPYNFSMSRAVDPSRVEYEWRVNRRMVTDSDNVLTVRRESSEVRAPISLSLSHILGSYQDAMTEFVVTLTQQNE